MVKRFFRIFGTGVKWLILALICVEIFCFLLITVTNRIMFGQPWEGARATMKPMPYSSTVKGCTPPCIIPLRLTLI